MRAHVPSRARTDDDDVHTIGAHHAASARRMTVTELLPHTLGTIDDSAPRPKVSVIICAFDDQRFGTLRQSSPCAASQSRLTR